MLERLYYFRLESQTDNNTVAMIFDFRRLVELGIVCITKDGSVQIDCMTLFVISATFNDTRLCVINGAITFILPTELKSMAMELLLERNVPLCVDVCPNKSKNKAIKAKAGLTPAPVPTTVPPRHVPVATVNDNGTIKATVCVSSMDAECFGNLVPEVIPMDNACCGDITLYSNDVTKQGEGRYSLNLPDGRVLGFTFHRNIAKEAMGLLQKARVAADEAEGHANIEQRKQRGLKAMMKDSRQGANGSVSREPVTSAINIPFSALDGQVVVSPELVFRDDESLEVLIQNADVAPSASAAPASAAPALASLPREKVANALSGAFDAVLFRDEQQALEKAKRDDQKAKREAEKAQRFEQQRQTEEAEARRLQDLADIERVEQERKEAKAKALYSALVNEFQSIEPVVLIAVGLKTLEQWLTNPDEYRARIGKLMNPAQQEEAEKVFPTDDSYDENHQIYVQTPRLDVVNKLKTLAKKQGLQLPVTEQQHVAGIKYIIDVSALLAKGVLKLRVSALGNEIVVGVLTSDGTQQWGTCANVTFGSYVAVVSMFPEMDVTVQDVIATRDALKIQKPYQRRYQYQQQGLLPNPGLVCVMPVCDAWGRFVGFQQAPPFA
jgi:hypothetical protein